MRHAVTRIVRLIGAGATSLALVSGGWATIAGATTITGVSISPATGPSVTVGATLSASLVGSPAGSVSYQWYDCASPVSANSGTPSSCSSIGSATSSSYVLQASDFQKYVTVAATDSGTGGATVYAASTSAVTEPAPSASSPTLAVSSASPVLGTAVAASNDFLLSGGSTQNGITAYNATSVAYAWMFCAASYTSTSSSPTFVAPTGCSALSGATSSSYTPGTANVGYSLAVAETVTNAVGSVTVYSATTNAVAGSAPTYTSGLPTPTSDGLHVSLSGFGTWGGTPQPTSYSVTWYRCAAVLSSTSTTLPSACGTGGSTGSPVPLASYSNVTTTSAATYTLSSNDVGGYVFAGVSANNGFTSATSAYSASTSVITQQPPVPLASPTVGGSAVPGLTVTVTSGTWTGLPTPVLRYQWYWCTASTNASGGSTSGTGTTPSAFSGCTAEGTGTSQLVGNWTGYLTPVVTATTTYGSSVDYYQIWPAQTSIAALTAPTSLGVTASSGSNATYTGSATATGGTSGLSYTYSYEWYACSAAVTAGSVTSGSSFVAPSAACAAVGSGTTYAVTSANLATFSTNGGLVLEAIATVSGVGSWYQWGASTSGLTQTVPTFSTLVVSATSSGTAASSSPVGTTVYAVANLTAMPTASLSYVWSICTSAGAAGSSLSATGCSSAASTTSSSFSPSLTATQLASGSTYYVVVAATANNGLTTTYYSAGVPLTVVAPALQSPPTLPASASTATPLVASPGTWLGAPAPTFTYYWYACGSAVASYSASLSSACGASAIAGGVNVSSFQPTGTYVGDYFVVGVTADNGVVIGGASTAKTYYSASTTLPLVATLSVTSVAVSGSAAVGASVTAVPTVTSTGAYATSYQWYACNATVTAGVGPAPTGCVAITGATLSTFAPTVSQLGYYLLALVTVSGNNTTASAHSATTSAVTSNTPGAPTSVVAVAGIGSATVSWTAPTTGLAATSYKVTASNGGSTCTATTTSCVVPNLLYGTYYTFTVVASNAYGAGPVSLASNAVNPLEAAPGVATSVVATPLALSALVRWTAAPANGAVIARYTVTATPGGQSCVTVTTSCTVTGLLSTQAYTFTVTATNVVGTGPVSLASAPVTPKVPGPNAPSVVTVRRAGSGTLVVSWRPGLVTTVPVTGFLAVATAPNGARAGSCAVTSGTSCVIRGLTDGTTYSVAVYAQSASGTSSPVVKAGVKVAGPPSVPVIVTSRRGPGVAILIVRAPRVFHGAPVAYYQILLGGRWSVQPVKGRTVIVLRGLARHARFVLRVRAVTFAGASAPSNAVVLVTL